MRMENSCSHCRLVRLSSRASGSSMPPSGPASSPGPAPQRRSQLSAISAGSLRGGGQHPRAEPGGPPRSPARWYPRLQLHSLQNTHFHSATRGVASSEYECGACGSNAELSTLPQPLGERVRLRGTPQFVLEACSEVGVGPLVSTSLHLPFEGALATTREDGREAQSNFSP